MYRKWKHTRSNLGVANGVAGEGRDDRAITHKAKLSGVNKRRQGKLHFLISCPRRLSVNHNQLWYTQSAESVTIIQPKGRR